MPVKYIPYVPNTIDGQAVLDNVTRTRRVLRYRDNGRVYDRIRRGLPLYEVDTIETIGTTSDNLLIRGECLSACAYLKDKGTEIDLVYIDPPFASGADYAKKVYLRRHPKEALDIDSHDRELEVAIENGEEVNLEELRAFEEKMYGDIWNKEDYLNWMYENLAAIKSVMSETGSIYVHLDWHIGHYVKVLLDEIFGEDNFLNEIVWQRTGAHNDPQRYGNIFDSILFYARNNNYTWNVQYTEYSEEYVQERFSSTEKGTGRKYWLNTLTAPAHGRVGKPAVFSGQKRRPPPGTMWRFTQDKINELEKQKRIVVTKSGMPYIKQYLDESEGRPLQSIWTDVPMSKSGKERTDYNTQKPQALLERIIRVSSNEGMVVADFFGGSGTTANAAYSLNRRFVHVDVGLNSVQTTRDRLKAQRAGFTLLDIQDGVSLFRNPAQTMDKLKTLITGLKNEDSLDKFWEGAIHDSKLGMMPVFVPNLLDHTTKVLDIPLMNRVLREALPDLPDGVRQAIVYYVDIDDRKALEKFIKEHNPTDIKIELRDLKQVLDEVVLNDIVKYKARKMKSGYGVEIVRFVSDRLQQKIDEYNQKKGLSDKSSLFDSENGDENEEDSEKNAKPKKKAKFKPIEISDDGLELIELVSLDCTAKKGQWHADSEIKIDKKGFVIRDGQKTKDFWDAKIQSKKKPLRMKVRNIAGDESILSLEQSN